MTNEFSMSPLLFCNMSGPFFWHRVMSPLGLSIFCPKKRHRHLTQKLTSTFPTFDSIMRLTFPTFDPKMRPNILPFVILLWVLYIVIGGDSFINWFRNCLFICVNFLGRSYAIHSQTICPLTSLPHKWVCYSLTICPWAWYSLTFCLYFWVDVYFIFFHPC